MDALQLLRSQHKEVQALYEAFKRAEKGSSDRRRIFEKTTDALAIHARIEEEIFYPACLRANVEVDMAVMVEEHLWVKRMIADALDLEGTSERFDACVEVMCENALHHAKEEEKVLFKEVRAKLDRQALKDLGRELEALAEGLIAEVPAPREEVPLETAEPAPIA